MSRPHTWEVAAFAVALVVTGLVALTLVFSGAGTYADLATASGRGTVSFTSRGQDGSGGSLVLHLPALADMHARWTEYVSGRSPDPPRTFGRQFFTGDEYAHMADVRSVLIAAQAAAAAGAAAAMWLSVRAWRRQTLARLLRASALAALAGVGVVAAISAVAFDAAFLLFHQVFFPQGNFLFAPDSNLLALYPEAYFYGVMLRIGAAFVAGSLALAAIAHASLRRPGASA